MFLVALLGYQALANDSFAEVGRRYMLQHGLDERDVDWLRFSQTVRSIAGQTAEEANLFSNGYSWNDFCRDCETFFKKLFGLNGAVEERLSALSPEQFLSFTNSGSSAKWRAFWQHMMSHVESQAGAQSARALSGWRSEFTAEENAEANGWFWDVVKTVFGWIFGRGVRFDENKFLDQLETKLGRNFQTRKFTRSQVEGGVWIRGNADELTLSAFVHPSKSHSVGIRSGATSKILPEKIEVAPPGCWAVAFGNAGSVGGNEALYKIIE